MSYLRKNCLINAYTIFLLMLNYSFLISNYKKMFDHFCKTSHKYNNKLVVESENKHLQNSFIFLFIIISKKMSQITSRRHLTCSIIEEVT